MAQITPPVGFNLYVLQNLTGRDIWTVTRAAMALLRAALPRRRPDHDVAEIVLVLPRQMVGR